MKRKEVLELARIVKHYNDEHNNRPITFQKPERLGRGNYVVRLSTTKLFTSVFLERISGYIHFDEYNMYIGHYNDCLYMHIS